MLASALASSCLSPTTNQDALQALCIRPASLGLSRGVSDLRANTYGLEVHYSNGYLSGTRFPLSETLQQDGQSAIIEGVVVGLDVLHPRFVTPNKEPPDYRDAFGNWIDIRRHETSQFQPLVSIFVSFPLRYSADGELTGHSFDLQPIGGPLVTDFLIGRTLMRTGDQRLTLDVDARRLSSRIHDSLISLQSGTDDIQRLWATKDLPLIAQIAIIDHPHMWAGCRVEFASEYLASTSLLANFLNFGLDTRYVARHESLHLLDQHLGAISDSEAFQTLFSSIEATCPDFFTAINESTWLGSRWYGGHSEDNAKELFASFVNMALHHTQTKTSLPASIKPTVHRVSQTLIGLLEKHPEASTHDQPLIALLGSMCALSAANSPLTYPEECRSRACASMVHQEVSPNRHLSASR